MKRILRSLGCFLAIGHLCALAVETTAVPDKLKVAVVQMALNTSLESNCDRIVKGISDAARRGVRVVVFPEGALRGKERDPSEAVEQAVVRIRQAARQARVYVLFGGATYSTTLKRTANWMLVVGPNGRDVFRYDKLYDNRRTSMPGVFEIDGIPCSAIICADRWLRGVEEIPIQQGARISFELSCNFASEWVPSLGWYWYVPRAMRNNVWVVFANTGNRKHGVPDDPSSPLDLRHGHSAIITPAGELAAAARDDVEAVIVAELDLRQADRANARARSSHPALRPFWEAGIRLQSGRSMELPEISPLQCEAGEVTLAVAQVTKNPETMVTLIQEARARKADLVAFPARAISETALGQLQAAAKRHQMTVVVGMEHSISSERRNSAFVIGPDGSLLTRYDQLSAVPPFQAGSDPSAMWFRVKGIPAVVTVGEDALWTELAELAAVAGAQLHIHIDDNPRETAEAVLRQEQVWCNLASFQTFSAIANTSGSAIWEDLNDRNERKAAILGLPGPNTGQVEVYSPFSANMIVRAGQGAQIITATRRVGVKNGYHPSRTSNFNPSMDAWYKLGASLVLKAKNNFP